jgi:hypothetical protein
MPKHIKCAKTLEPLFVHIHKLMIYEQNVSRNITLEILRYIN